MGRSKPAAWRLLCFFFAGVCSRWGAEAGLAQLEISIQQAIQGGDLPGADRMLADALNAHPQDGGLLNLRGIVYAQQGEMQKARRDFATAVRVAPALTPAWQNLARACQTNSANDRSSADCAVSAWRRVQQLRPGDQEARLALTTLYEHSDRYAESLRESQQLSAAEGLTTATMAVRCADLAGLGRTAEAKSIASQLASRSDFDEAAFAGIENALQSKSAAPTVVLLVEALDARQAASVKSLRPLAIAYESLGRTADARKVLERVATLDATNPAHLLELARLAEVTKDHEGALGYLGHARDLKPQDPQIDFLFGVIADEMNLPVEARRSFARALSRDPDNPNYNYAMGSVILTTRDAASAAGYFQRFLAAKPSDPQGHFALGIAYFSSGDYAKAKAEMETVRSDPRTAAGAEYFLGRMARLDGDTAQARLHLEKSIALMPSTSETHTELARVLMLEGRMETAHAELNRALQLDPQSFLGNEQLLVYFKRTHDSRTDQQANLLKKLDEERSRRAELMLRTIEVRP